MSNLEEVEKLKESFCTCGKKHKFVKPRVYGRTCKGECIVVNYDMVCKRCGKRENFDIY